MFNRYLTYYTPGIQFVIFCGISSMMMILGQMAASVVFEKISGISILALLDMEQIPASLALQFKLINTLSQLLSLLLPAVLFAYFAYPRPGVYLGIHYRVKPTFLLLMLALFIVSMPFTSWLEELSRLIPAFRPPAKDQTELLYRAMLKGNGVSDLLINILTMCLIPALAEEFFFRGALQQLLLNWFRQYPYAILLLIAIAFSAFHGQLSGFIPRVFMGFVLCLVYYFTANLWYAILIHFLNNLFIVVVAFLAENNQLDFDQVQQMSLPWTIGLLSLALTACLLFFLYRQKVEFVPVAVEKNDEEERADR